MSGKAKFEILAEDKTAAAWRSAIGTAKSSSEQIAHAFEAAFAGVSVAAISELAMHSLELGDSLNKAAIKAGIGGKAMSELAYAAKLSDVDVTGLSTALKKMQVALSEATTGNKQAQGAFAALGIKLQDIQRLKPEDQFELIADRINLLKSPADKTRAAVELFGRAGADLLPMFAQGAEGIRKAREEANRLGAALGDEQIKKLAEAEDEVKRLKASWEGLAASVTADVAPVLRRFFGMLHGEDARTDLEKIDGQITELQRKLTGGQFGGGVGSITGQSSAIGWTDQQFEQAKQQLEELQIRRAFLAAPTALGGRGRPEDLSVPGFTDTEAAKKAADAAKKAAEDYHNDLFKMDQEVGKQLDDNRKKEVEGWFERKDAADAWYNEYLKREKEAQVLREQDAQRTAMFIKGTLLQAFDDWINTGKFSFKQFLAYLAAELARSQFAKLLTSLGNSMSSSSSSGGLLSTVVGAIGSLFGGSDGAIDGKASGGPVMGGRTYLVGENGPELFRSGSSGWITPNNALGAGGGVNINLSIDARGATVDAIKLLPAFGRQIVDQAEQKIVGRLKRDYYGLRGQ